MPTPPGLPAFSVITFAHEPRNACYLGLDLGTSGVRAVAIDAAGHAVDAAARPLPPPEQTADGARRQDPALWLDAALEVIAEIAASNPNIEAIAIDGTSGTLLLADADGTPLSPGSMYNDASCAARARQIAAVAPAESAAHGATSPLARLLAMQERYPAARFALHQADWVAGQLTEQHGVSDDNNALKLGWDPVQRRWPAWLDRLGVQRRLLPAVVLPGTAIAPISPRRARQLALPPSVMIIAGTTDGCASFLATGADAVGDAVTALGSTLTVKLLSDRPLFAPQYGVYSHRLGERWLAGGASNTGGTALLRFFSAEQMAALTPLLQPEHPTGLDYYPLPSLGERFPVADPMLTSRHEPRPSDDARFFQGLLEGIAAVEAQAYSVLRQLGGPPLRSVRSIGGGASNPAWTAIRHRRLGVPMLEPLHPEAAYGTARLAAGVIGQRKNALPPEDG